MRAPGRTPEVITTRTALRRAAVVAGALVLVASSTANPPVSLPAEAATIATPEPPAAVVQELLADRAERAAAPPAARRATAVRAVRARAVTARLKARTTSVQRAAAVRLVRIRAVVRFARSQIGDPYRFGAVGPGAWDCSGLTRGSYARAGIRLPRQASAQSARGRGVTARAARVGDLALWGGVGSAYHVGLYLGGGWVLHSPRPGKRVQIAKLWGRPQFRRLL